jgi:UDP-sulfoquinovose synthase
MRVLVLGGDGYLGWPIALRFSARGAQVCILDNLARRRRQHVAMRDSLISICSAEERISAWTEIGGAPIRLVRDDLTRPGCAPQALRSFGPDVVVHLAAQASAPWAAASVEQAVATFEVNMLASLRVLWAVMEMAPHAHLVKLGTMGEYGRPGIDIAEGPIIVDHRGRRDRLPFPQRPRSLYDLSKRHDADNALFAAEAWGLRLTLLRQSAVFGAGTAETRRDPRLATRFDYDPVFGASLNRFCVQALARGRITIDGDPSAAYPIIGLDDAVRCVELAVDNPPSPGRPRICHQLTDVRPLEDVARLVADAARERGSAVTVHCRGKPGSEPQYAADASALRRLGLTPTPLPAGIASTLDTLVPHLDRVRDHVLDAQLLPAHEPDLTRVT